MNNLLDQANAYIQDNKHRTKNHPVFHYTPQIGWMNDPNGLCYFKGEYHLYYQYNPYGIHWDTMYWGHATSKDLIHWKDLPVALAPQESYEIDGCFSGSAIEVDGKLYLMYTGHIDRKEGVRQNQNIAMSEDGLVFEKLSANPVLDENDLPSGAIPDDFRDPKVFESDGSYWAVIAARPEEQGGAVLLYESKNLIEWKYKGILAKSQKGKKEIWECPDLFTIGEQEVLIYSIIELEKNQQEGNNLNMHPTKYRLGAVSLEHGQGSWQGVDDLDCGFNFYAPQTFLNEEGQRIMMGWISPWEADDGVRLENAWAGIMSIPRVLSIKEGCLVQEPIEAIKKLRKAKPVIIKESIIKNEIVSFDHIRGQSFDLSFKVDMNAAESFTLEIGKGKKCSTKLTYDYYKKEWTFDRSQNGEKNMPSLAKENPSYAIRTIQENDAKHEVNFRVLMDRYSLEIFADGGKRVFTALINPHDDGEKIEFSCVGRTILYDVEFYSLM